MDKNNPYQVLVIEDEPSLKAAIDAKLQGAGLKTAVFDDGQLALDAIDARGKQFDGIWLDFDVRGINGLQFMERFIKFSDWQKCPVLIVSNTGNPDLIKQTIDLGAKEWIIKAEVRLDDTVRRFIELIDAAKAAAYCFFIASTTTESGVSDFTKNLRAPRCRHCSASSGWVKLESTMNAGAAGNFWAAFSTSKPSMIGIIKSSSTTS